MISSDNLQLRQLVDQGFSLEEAAVSLGIDPEIAKVTFAAGQKVDSLEELVENFKPQAVKVLMDIAKFGENESARVKAASILLTGSGVLPEASPTALTNRLKLMKRAIVDAKEKVAPKLIDLEPVSA